MSKKPKLTPWFDGDVKPVRPGVYECDWGRKDHPTLPPDYNVWTGSVWLYGCGDIERTARLHGGVCGRQNRAWRGLAADPMLAGHT